ncbi:Putative uncharacterized protein FLJ37770 [Eumeta japonica]|uniref:Histone-lysine N-methyltransferase SETMAR n=1 Tax=Eumeta variegata TaxID=151549 RepID=A0A4C1TBK6_EUMVA|nr:Putative uncharacterized protein FLJ37770 [Eumeta japonica]
MTEGEIGSGLLELSLTERKETTEAAFSRPCFENVAVHQSNWPIFVLQPSCPQHGSTTVKITCVDRIFYRGRFRVNGVARLFKIQNIKRESRAARARPAASPFVILISRVRVGERNRNKRSTIGFDAVSSCWETMPKILVLQDSLQECFIRNLRLRIRWSKNGLAHFNKNESCEDDPRPGRLVTVVTEENVRKIEKLVLADRRIKLWQIAEELQISKKRVGEIIHEHMNMRKISARWVPKMLTPFDKQRRLQTSKDFLELVGDNIDEICDRIVTVDETWVRQYDPESKQESMQWTKKERPPKKFKVQKSASKLMATIFGIVKVFY